jgi:hypothetical protein
MARLVIVAPDDDPPADPPKCRHLGCGEPGTEVTELVRGRRSWELRHCLEHKGDGLDIARQAGFLYDDPSATSGSPDGADGG